MRNKVENVKLGKFNVASLVSTTLAVCTFALWLATFAVTPWDHKISLTKNFHVSVWKGFSGDTFGRLVIFNDAQYGPYRGSIMSLGGEDTHETRRGWHAGDYDVGQITFTNLDSTSDKLKACDLPGIYFRYWQMHDQERPLWTLMISLWYPLFLFSILPVIWIFHHWRLRHSKSSHC
jgi:hypothetical protein